MIYVM